MRKLARTSMDSWKRRQLADQGGKCPLCGLVIDTSIKGEAVVDHDHNTGEIRGVLHRSCNAALGKMDNAVGRWGCKSMDYTAIKAWLRKAIAYYDQPGLGIMYHSHKSAAEKAQADKLKARKRAAESRARKRLKERAE